MAFVDVFIATLKTNPCFESKVNVCYGVAMFRLLLLISCLGFVVGCGDESVSEPTAAEPTVMEPTVVEPTVVEPTVVEPTVVEPTVVEPTVVEPTVVEPTVVEPTVVEPTVVEPTVVEPTVVEPTVVEPRIWAGDATGDNLDELASGGYTEITGYLRVSDTQIDTIDLPQLQSVGGNVYISRNASLTTITMPQLETVDGC